MSKRELWLGCAVKLRFYMYLWNRKIDILKKKIILAILGFLKPFPSVVNGIIYSWGDKTSVVCAERALFALCANLIAFIFAI